ncbi:MULTISPECIES: beta-ketoacyl-[acyl-carrier-protein] synthase family protein [unclassified Nitrospina]|uniref:beta-ketoacyl-[acyl-carrier-protein] synthase family protein n=1 Tax=unclassified Nitrospina TaxID=2638683 RepID=UPI003F9C8E9C
MRREDRIVITGIGLTAPNGNSLPEFRQNLLEGRSGVQKFQTRFMGEVLAGVCNFDELRYQKKKEVRRGTRAGSIAVYCANEAVIDSGLDFAALDKSRIGVYTGTTEHGNVETENEVHNISQYDYDTKYWSHHHNPRTVANNPAGEVTLNMGITGPHYAIGAACAAGNLGIIQGVQMLRLGEVDLAIAGGVSESIHTFGIFASFKAEGALAHHADPTKASRPFDKSRNGIVCSEGGCLYTLERLSDAEQRGAKIYGEIVGYHSNSDAYDYILPEPGRQAECMQAALKKAGLEPGDVDILNTHATATQLGDIQEAKALRTVFPAGSKVRINNTKSYIGHTMGAAGALELTGNLPAFDDGVVHPTINVDEVDPECDVAPLKLVANQPERLEQVEIIVNNSFGMFGINSVLIVRKYQK